MCYHAKQEVRCCGSCGHDEMAPMAHMYIQHPFPHSRMSHRVVYCRISGGGSELPFTRSDFEHVATHRLPPPDHKRKVFTSVLRAPFGEVFATTHRQGTHA